jgi:hypothetical protein
MKNFKPKDGQKYWYIDGSINNPQFLSLHSDSWCEDDMYDYSNCFRTRVNASTALKKILKILS